MSHKHTFIKKAVADYPLVTRQYRTWGEKAKCAKRDRVYCLQTQSAIIAAARILEPAAKVYLLRNLTVAPSLRRRGLAGELLRAIAECDDVLPLYCYCRPYLKAFYGSQGFTPLAVERVPRVIAEPFARYLNNGKPFILMGKTYDYSES